MTNTFSGIWARMDIHIPNSVRDIRDAAFYKTCLDSLYLGANVMHIGKRAFVQPDHFSGTRAIVCYAEVPPVCDEEALDGISREKCVLYVPKDCEMRYRSTAPWSEFKQIRRIELNTEDAINDIVCQGLRVSRSEHGLIISGTERGEKIGLYSLSGTLLNSSVTSDDETIIPCHLQKGEAVIVKYGDKAVKVKL